MLITFKLWPITTKAQRVFTLGNPFQNHVPCPRDQPVTSSLPLRTRWWWSWWGAHFDWSLYMNMFNDQLSIYDVIVHYRINPPWCEEDYSCFNALLSFKNKNTFLRLMSFSNEICNFMIFYYWKIFRNWFRFK